MRRSDFQESSRNLGLGVTGVATHGQRHDNVVILHDWNFASNNWQANFLAAQTGGTWIFWIHGNRGVAKHGLGTSGGHGNRARTIAQRIFQVPHFSFNIAHDHFVVGNGRLGFGIPIHKAPTALNQTILKQPEKTFTHRGGAHWIHGETRAIKIARATHGDKLLKNDALIFIFPRLHLRHKFIARKISALLALQRQAPLNHRLRGDARVIRSWHPQHIAPSHARVAGQRVLQRVVQRVPQVQSRSDIGRRNKHGERLGFGLGIGLETTRVAPTFGDLAFMVAWSVGFRQATGINFNANVGDHCVCFLRLFWLVSLRHVQTILPTTCSWMPALGGNLFCRIVRRSQAIARAFGGASASKRSGDGPLD